MSFRHHEANALAALVLSASALLAGAGVSERTWTRVQYHGGALGTEGASPTWNNSLTISNRAIALTNGGRLLFEINPNWVTALSYEGLTLVTGNEVAARSAVSGAIELIPGLLLLHRKDHYLAIEYRLPDGRLSAVLLRLDKGNYQEIRDALHDVTGIPREQKKPPPERKP